MINPAEKVVRKFGGQTALAVLIGKGQTTVQYWTKTGTIPARWHGKLIRLAQERGIRLTPADLVTAETSKRQEEGQNVALWSGILPIGELELPVHVLKDGRRIISRKAATDVLTEKKGGGNLESYLNVKALQPYIGTDYQEQLIEFLVSGVENKTAKGMEAETFLAICRAFVQAHAETALSPTQTQIAIRAAMFLAACAKIGLIALIDEATGYQYERAEDALQVKLKLFLEEEMRGWEKTFPDELWVEFGRLTRWRGAVHSRPKYWGILVMELVYGYLDPDVRDWLKENALPPRHGKNYHQWMSSHYGLKRLIEHIWMLIGMARSCHTMPELRERMAHLYGRSGIQMHLFLPPQLPSPRGNRPKTEA